MSKPNNSAPLGGGGKILKPSLLLAFQNKYNRHLEAIAESSLTNSQGILRFAQNDRGKQLNPHPTLPLGEGIKDNKNESRFTSHESLNNSGLLRSARNDEKRNHLSTYSPIDLSTCKKKAAFTLAEVLITLGIIGVVAAMTIPNLIANTNSHKYRTGYKKAVSTLNQAIRSNIAHFDYDFSNVSNCIDAPTDHPENTMSICAIFNGSLSGHTISDYTQLKIPHSDELYYIQLYRQTTPDTHIKNQGVNLFYYQMKDGMLFAFHAPFDAGDTSCTLNGRTLDDALKDNNFIKYCVGWVDVNGVSLPNKETKCADGKSHSKDIENQCIVPNKANYMNDVFPLAFYDGTVAPASAAARYVLNTTK